jgi:hypothetical protein
VFPSLVPEFREVISAGTTIVTVVLVDACAGVSTVNAKATDAAVASANFALRVNFM